MHLGINICGVKIYSHSIMKKYPYMASYFCEVDQTKRLREDGCVSINVSPKLSATDIDDSNGSNRLALRQHVSNCNDRNITNKHLTSRSDVGT